MTNIDQFESVFKAADKPAFVPEQVELRSILVVTTLDSSSAKVFEQAALSFLGSSATNGPFSTRLVQDSDFLEVRQLLQLVEDFSPDLVCTYRNLKRPANDYPFSLGVFVDVLTQATQQPVLLLPAPAANPDPQTTFGSRQRVMAITDHLSGDHHLVSFAARLSEPGGRLWLAHVEDEATFERYIETISRIPTIETDEAREALLERLMKEPRDYILSCKEVLSAAAAHVEIHESVTLGHQLGDYKRLIEEHQIDLVVMNTKDEDQLAMHGAAYPWRSSYVRRRCCCCNSQLETPQMRRGCKAQPA